MALDLPDITVATIEDLHVLAMLDEPRFIDLVSIPAVRRAAEFVVAITPKVDYDGWVCNKLEDLRRVRRFDDLLTDLQKRILPMLGNNPDDKAALRNLRTCGYAMWSVRQHAHPSLHNLVGFYSNTVTRKARQALDPYKAYTIKREWLHAMALRVEGSRSAFMPFDSDYVPPSPPMPTIVVSSLVDVHGVRFAIDPHRVELGAVDAVRLAPEYLHILLEKVEQEGWICPTLPALRHVARFANLLTDLQDRVLPGLLNDHTDPAVLRKLRTCGCGMKKLRAVAKGPLLRLTRLFSNCLTRHARDALDARKDFRISADWIDKIAVRVDRCLTIPLHLHHHLEDPFVDHLHDLP